MPLDVALGDAIVVGSMMILDPTVNVVALSVPVGAREATGEGLYVPDTMVGIGMVAESLLVGIAVDVGASLIVAFPELGAVNVALLGGPEEIVEAGDSDAGTLTDSLTDRVGPDEAEVPTEPDDGKMPALGEGVALGVTLGIGGVTLTLAVSEGVGKTPDDETRPEDGTTPEEG